MRHSLASSHLICTDEQFSGYSFVYLVQDESSHLVYALKKIRCPIDGALSDAMHEIEMYRLFQSEYIIKVLVKELKMRREE